MISNLTTFAAMFMRNETFQDSLQPVVTANAATDSISLIDSSTSASSNIQAIKPAVKEKVEEPEILPNFFYTSFTKELRPRLRKTDAEGWVLPLLLCAFFLAAIVNTLFPKTIRNILMNFLKRDTFRKIREEDNLLYRRTLALMLLIFLIVSPVFIYQVAGYFDLSTAFLPFMPAYWQLFLIGAGILGFKLFTIQLLGYFFNCTVEAGQYIAGIIMMNCFLGVLFIPISLGIKISASEISGYLLMAGLGLFGLFYLISLMIGISAGIRSEALSKFHLILYFCTLEILPVFLIIKTVRNIL
jgi:hypothetical protein